MENVAQSQGAGEPTAFTKEQVSALLDDPKLRQLRPDSAEYQAAVAEKFSNKTSSESATEASDETEVTKTEAVSDEPDSDETKTETVEEDAGLSKRAQKRINQLYGRSKAAEEERDALKARIAELEGSKAKSGETPTVAAKPTDNQSAFDKPEPKLDEFNNISEYAKALTRWEIQKDRFEERQAVAAKDHETKFRGAFDKFRAAGSELEKELGLKPGDFEHVVSNEELRLVPDIKAALLESEFGNRIAFEWGSDDELAKKISGMSPAQQLREIGKLEAKFEGQKKSRETQRTVSGAKAPSKSLTKGSPAAKATGLNFTKDMDYEEFKRQRNAMQK